MTLLDPIFNPVFQPLLNASPFWAIVVLSFLVSVLITLVYKLVTNQTQMKELKEKQKEYQKQMRDLKSNPPEMMKVQKEAMQLNMQYMKQSFKPTLITMLPILVIFSWMTAHLSFEPIYPGEPYSISANFNENLAGEAEIEVSEGTEILSEKVQPITGAVTWNLKSSEGEHKVQVKVGEEIQSKDVLITSELKYAEPLTAYKHSSIEKITINYNKLKPLGEHSILGWNPGWLGLYIILSIVFSMALRKLLKVY
ncbi:MAG TPA: EMC3/TMCO1 family protein [Candidatus Nanoarchaeia archaeon]|nr:EMC3/TMCO1 family protein [Candidatus Nanoarchaeia archaeon]